MTTERNIIPIADEQLNREFTIYTAKTRHAKTWTRTPIRWRQFLAHVENPTRTWETMEQYQEMPQAEKASVKDVGGFVAGELREGKRKKGYVKNRCWLTLDADHLTQSLEEFQESFSLLYDVEACIYTTHSSTKEQPRLRLIVPLTRPVLPEEYEPLARQVANTLGMDQFDDTTYEPNRLMYFPSCSSNGLGNYQGIRLRGRGFLNPDGVLQTYGNAYTTPEGERKEAWMDASVWPTSSRESTLLTTEAKKQEDPLGKQGIVGLFCRAYYPIQSAIDTFLTGIYEASFGGKANENSYPNRYSYLPGESRNGVVVYEDKFVYSHHETDPASHLLVNAFDLIRLHQFKDLDEGEGWEPETPDGRKRPVTASPSYKRMIQFCQDLPAVKEQLAKEHGWGESAGQEFAYETEEEEEEEEEEGTPKGNKDREGGSVKDSHGETTPETNGTPPRTTVSTLALREPTLTPAKRKEAITELTENLQVSKQGVVENTLLNCYTILTYDPNLYGIQYNAFDGALWLRGGVPWDEKGKADRRTGRKGRERRWTETDYAHLQVYLSEHYTQFPKQSVDTALTSATENRSFHPIRDYLSRLPAWDKTPRVDTLFIDTLGAEDDSEGYTRAVTAITFIGAVARILEEREIKFDTMAILIGAQGQKKSTLIRRITRNPEWFSDDFSLAETKDKTAAEKIQGKWIVEVAELNGLRKAESEQLKSFLSRSKDTYRAAYAHQAEDRKRQCIFIGTTNEQDGILRDGTGGRRFYPIETTKTFEGDMYQKIPDDWVDQFWAEALHRYQQGEKWYLTDPKILKKATQEQQDRTETDYRVEEVMQYLDTPLPEEKIWEELSIADRAEYYHQVRNRGIGKPPVLPLLPEGTPCTRRRDTVCLSELWGECFGEIRNFRKRDQWELKNLMTDVCRVSKEWNPPVRGRIGSKLYDRQRWYTRKGTEVEKEVERKNK